MAIRDLEAFVRERAAVFDPNLDLTPGSPFDKQVIQPLVRRLGNDPFTIDLETFLTSRLQQAFPELATNEGDALVDLLIKPAQLLWDPIVREVNRVRKGLSFKDPNTLTTDEAEALGANLFAERPQGEFARGLARIFFSQAQNAVVTPVNIITSRGGLVFVPTETQSIRVEEMLINDVGDGTFYFDVNVVAESPGDQYNIGPNQLVSVANLESAVRVTNLRRFRGGVAEMSAATFVDRSKQDLTERSMVTIRGIASKLTRSFPEISRLNVVGYSDPEMQRDVIRGGGLGPIIAAGSAGAVLNDNVGKALSTRFSTAEADFTAAIGPVRTTPKGFILTVFGATGIDPAKDLTVAKVLDANTVEVSESELEVGETGLTWSLRKKELSLSKIPGGILFPSSVNGEVQIPDDEIHIGGTTDVYTRGPQFDEAVLFIDALADDDPELSGLTFNFTDGTADQGTLDEFVLDTDYELNDDTYKLLARAARDALSLQVLDGINAGTYRILSVTQTASQPPTLKVTPSFLATTGIASARWRITDVVNVNLTDIKESKVSGNDLVTTQNSAIVSSSGGTDYDELGIAEGDTLRILNGPDAGDYRLVEDPLSPGFTQVRIDTKLTISQTGVAYEIFRANAEGNLSLPLVRIKEIELLDSSNQPLGTKVPYALPVDAQSNSFQNPARGVKHRFTDTLLGLITLQEPGGGFAVGGLTLTLATPQGTVNITFTAGSKTATEVRDEINTAVAAQTTPSENGAAILVGTRVGIRPFGAGGDVQVTGGTARTALFGSSNTFTVHDVRSATADAAGGWDSLDPAIDLDTGLDILQMVDGNQIGFLRGPYTQAASGALRPTALDQPLSPEDQVTVEVGARSIGSIRVFFLEPTSFETRTNETFFELETESGSVRFTPDPTLDHQRIPALPNGDKPLDGVCSEGGSTFTSTSQDLLKSGIQAGDKLEIDYFPISGTVVLADPVPTLVNKTLIFSINGGPNKTLIFIRDDVSLATDEVTRDGVIEQINAAAGLDIAQLTSDNRVEFEADAEIIIRQGGTANSVILGNVSGTSPVQSFSLADQRNHSPFIGSYVIASIDTQTQLTIEGTFTASGSNLIPPFSSPVSRQQFKITRAGVQRISTTEMGANEGEAGLFYFDVELVSEGTGDVYNIAAAKQLKVYGYRSDGYYLTTDDPNLTFSNVEKPRLVITRSILESGLDDDPSNATQLAGQNLQITYDRSSLVTDVNNLITSEVERVVCSSPLSRHLIPHFVRFDATYRGGSREEVVIEDLNDYIVNRAPIEAIESSDIQKIIGDRGADSIKNPISLIAIVHNIDRTITAARSLNRLTTGRLAAFIPDALNITRDVT